jgi:hypothetical protein
MVNPMNRPAAPSKQSQSYLPRWLPPTRYGANRPITKTDHISLRSFCMACVRHLIHLVDAALVALRHSAGWQCSRVGERGISH